MKKKIQMVIFSIITFLFCNLINSQNFDKGKITQTDYFEEIDLEIIHDKIIIPVTIGSKTYRFMLDTGAPNLISKEVAEDIKLNENKSIAVKDANNNVGKLEIGAIGTIKLGRLTSEQNVVLISDLNEHPLLSCYHIDGLLGSNFFKNSILKISLKEKKIWVTDKIKNLKITVSSSKLSLVGDQSSPYIKVNFLNNEKIKGSEELMIDTGMGGFYEISNRAFSQLKKENFFNIIGTSKGTGSVGLFGAGDEKIQYLLQTNYFKINQTQFLNVITTTSEDQNSRLGIDFLKYGDVALDFKNKKFYFEAAPTIEIEDSSPIYAPTMADNKLIVGFVWDLKYADLMEYGDEILAIGPYKLSETKLCDILELKKYRQQNPTHELEIKRKNNQIKKIKITSKQ